jgi:hypothetical protein
MPVEPGGDFDEAQDEIERCQVRRFDDANVRTRG